MKTKLYDFKYVIGDATEPQGDGIKIICHVCNNVGAWGKGFVSALSNKWTEPERMYRNLRNTGYILGNVQYVKVTDDIIVANMIGQEGINIDANGNPPIRYNAIMTALKNVFHEATVLNATVHMPRIGSGLAGGDWNTIEDIIKSIMSTDVTVYNLK